MSDDDRITCVQCSELAPNFGCRAAMRRERKDVISGYGPAHPTDLLRRCEFFVPKRDAEDQRHGRERWPELYDDYLRRMKALGRL